MHKAQGSNPIKYCIYKAIKIKVIEPNHISNNKCRFVSIFVSTVLVNSLMIEYVFLSNLARWLYDLGQGTID
jgi:hypothetical protein